RRRLHCAGVEHRAAHCNVLHRVNTANEWCEERVECFTVDAKVGRCTLERSVSKHRGPHTGVKRMRIRNFRNDERHALLKFETSEELRCERHWMDGGAHVVPHSWSHDFLGACATARSLSCLKYGDRHSCTGERHGSCEPVGARPDY